MTFVGVNGHLEGCINPPDSKNTTHLLSAIHPPKARFGLIGVSKIVRWCQNFRVRFAQPPDKNLCTPLLLSNSSRLKNYICHHMQLHFQYGFESDSEPVRSHTEKSCIALYYRQFYTNSKIKIIKFIQVLFLWTVWATRANKNVFHFNICEKLSVIRCDK